MRLWHQKLIPFLPRQQLLGQHRECCALRGNGWGRKHSTIDYIFRYTRFELVRYHNNVMDEMERRGYKVNSNWKNVYYCGLVLGKLKYPTYSFYADDIVYKEHNNNYMKECLDNLKNKGIILEVENEN